MTDIKQEAITYVEVEGLDYDYKSEPSPAEREFLWRAWTAYDDSGYEIDGGGHATDKDPMSHEERVAINFAIAQMREFTQKMTQTNERMEYWRDKFVHSQAKLKAMTEDRDLWRGEHNDDCPNYDMLELERTDKAEIEAKLKTAREDAFRDFINEICRDLPVDYSLDLLMENGSGYFELCHDGMRINFEDYSSVDYPIEKQGRDALEYAIKRSGALKEQEAK